ncbi:hypothetical protein KP509_18G004400 [Ceratopteris richardii]|uniref:Uncharacterized protein n=1 Tax=Ceratopteris richardii TaxID=49495 RepID=A0A8T2SQT6_CERRI|nr:hypothetical protein KP509_18G004400 [Ceratopteris richardii]
MAYAVPATACWTPPPAAAPHGYGAFVAPPPYGAVVFHPPPPVVIVHPHPPPRPEPDPTFCGILKCVQLCCTCMCCLAGAPCY